MLWYIIRSTTFPLLESVFNYVLNLILKSTSPKVLFLCITLAYAAHVKIKLISENFKPREWFPLRVVRASCGYRVSSRIGILRSCMLPSRFSCSCIYDILVEHRAFYRTYRDTEQSSGSFFGLCDAITE